MKLFSKGKLHIHIIVLAAGFSKRYSETENKLLALIDGKPMYRHIVDKLINIKHHYGNIENIVVVTQYFDIEQELKKDKKDVKCIYNSHPERGISSSTLVGLAYSIKLKEGSMDEGEIKELDFVEDEKHAYMFVVADQPYLQEKSLKKFLSQYIKSKKGIGTFSSNGVLGNPVIFDSKYVPELFSLDGDKGGKKVVNNHLDDTFIFEVEAKENEDIDYKK